VGSGSTEGMSFSRFCNLAWLQVCLLMLLNGCATRILLHPDTARKAASKRPVSPDAFDDHPEIIQVTNQWGFRLEGWGFFSPTNHGVVLIGDGNATGIAHTYEYNRYLLNRGLNVLVLSYQGFDSNGGEADLNSLYGDLDTFYSFCQKHFPGEPIAFMAESISTAPFFCFASHHPEIRAIVLEAMVEPKSVAYAKLNDWWLFYPLYPLTICFACLVSAGVPETLDVERALETSGAVPALFIHHPEDKITPYRTAQKIFTQYRGPKKWITLEKQHSRERHMTGSYDIEIQQEIVSFLKKAIERR
jgi:hypothetical protein